MPGETGNRHRAPVRRAPQTDPARGEVEKAGDGFQAALLAEEVRGQEKQGEEEEGPLPPGRGGEVGDLDR